ncbi:hypothetical protein PRIC2_003352 [Phytophthora ramorum]
MPSERCGDPHVATLEAFYTRVMQRVCSAYCEESELPAEEAAKLLQQKWKQKMELYTGEQQRSSSTAQDNGISVVETVNDSDVEASEEDADRLSSSPSSSSEEEAEAATTQVVGRPSAQVPTAATSTTSSIFARMLGGKRKLHQLDGAASDEEDAVEWQDAAVQEQQDLQGQSTVAREVSPTVVQDTEDERGESSSSDTQETLELFQPSSADEEEKDAETQQDNKEVPSSPAKSTASASLLVSAEDIAPVSGLSGSELPLQLAAEYTKFGHRGTRRGYVGELQAIVLTWPSRLGAGETVLPGELIWRYSDDSSGEGGLVKVLSLGDTIDELRVELSNGSVATVQTDRVHRLKEYLIRKGSVRLHS